MSVVDKSMDPEVLTAKGQLPHDEAQIAAHAVNVFNQLPTCHKQLARLTSLSFVRVGNESAVSNFCFQNLVAKNVHVVAMMRLVFGF